LKIRFYAVGEYGDGSERPHYHVVIFNWYGCKRLRTKRVVGTNKPDPENCCDNCRLVSRTWGMGNIELGELNPASAAYIAEYTVKKMTKASDKRLDGRFPEFARMSRQNGGIGSDAMWDVASTMLRVNLDNVPFVVQHGMKKLPLGRYLRRKLHDRAGVKYDSQRAYSEMEQEMFEMRLAAKGFAGSLAQYIALQNEQRIRNAEALQEIKVRRKRVI